MAVELTFSANLEEVRKQLDRFAAEARSKPVVVPVTGAGGVGAASGILGGPAVPTAAGVFAASGAGVVTPLGLVPTATPGFAGFGGGTAPVAGAILGGTNAGGGGGAVGGAGAAGGGGFFGSMGGRGAGAPMAGSGMFYGFGSRGLITSLATGMLASGFGRAAEAWRENQIAQTLAGGDMRAQLEATMRYREQLAMSFPFVGRAVSFLQDPSGMREAGIRSTLNMAEARDAQTAGLRRGEQFAARLRDERNLGGATSAHDRRMREMDIEHRKRTEDIKHEADDQAKLDRDVIAKRRAELESSRGARATAIRGRGATREFIEELSTSKRAAVISQLEVQDRAEIAAMETTAAQAREGRIRESTGVADSIMGMTRSAANYAERLRLRMMRSGLAAEISAYGFDAANDPRAAQMVRMRAAAAADIMEAYSRGESVFDVVRVGLAAQARIGAVQAGQAREDRYAGEDLAAQIGIANAVLSRNPLEARLRQIRMRREQGMRDPYADPTLIQFQSEAEEAIERQQVADEMALRQRSLEGRGRVLGAALRGGRFADVAARSAGIREEAELQADRLRREDPTGNVAAIQQIYRNAQDEQRLVMRSFLQSFRPTTIDPQLTDLSGRGSEDVVGLLKEIANNTRDQFGAR